MSDVHFFNYGQKGQMSNLSLIFSSTVVKNEIVTFSSKWSQNVPLVKTFTKKE